MADYNISTVHDIAAKYQIEFQALQAVVQVESAGAGFWNVSGVRKPVIRIEGHYFYKRLTGPSLRLAVKQGLASPKAGAVKNPKSAALRYAMFERMKEIDAEAAYQSISMGAGQVMGAHYALLGYDTAEDMFVECSRSLEHQIDQMADFINANGFMQKALNEHDWQTFAKLYNGKNYRVNRYDEKLELAYKALANFKAGIERALTKTKLANIDIDRIQNTGSASVKEFQEKNGLVPDGKLGPITAEVLTKVEVKTEQVKDVKASGIISASAGVVVALGTALTDGQDTLTKLIPYLDTLNTFGTYGPTMVLGVGVTAVCGTIMYSIYRWMRTQ